MRERRLADASCPPKTATESRGETIEMIMKVAVSSDDMLKAYLSAPAR